jgi:hypothetical protein
MRILLSILLLSVVTYAKFSIDSTGRKLNVYSDNIDLSKISSGAGPFEFEFLFESSNFDVLRIQTNSKNPQSSGQCGGGVEQLMIWIYTVNGRIKEFQYFTTHSCWKSIYADVSNSDSSITILNNGKEIVTFEKSNAYRGFIYE